jgi:hypothetical protein
MMTRIKRVRQLLLPLVPDPKGLFVMPKSTPDEFRIVAFGRGFANTGDFDNLRFSTVAPKFSAMYHERWNRVFAGKKESFYLYRAYLHLYQIDSVTGEAEFLLLHCDPNEPAASPHARYKQSLHLHIESSTAPWPHDIWPHSHLALNVAYLNAMLKDADSFTHALRFAVVMLREQVLDLLK